VEENGGSVEKNGGSVEKNGGSVEKHGESVEKNGESVEKHGGTVERNGGSVERTAEAWRSTANVWRRTANAEPLSLFRWRRNQWAAGWRRRGGVVGSGEAGPKVVAPLCAVVTLSAKAERNRLPVRAGFGLQSEFGKARSCGHR
jgi:hypothetical protein